MSNTWLTEWRTCLGDGLAVQTQDNTAQRLFAMLDVKVDLVGDLGAFSSLYSLAHEQESGGQDDHKRYDDSLDVRHFEKH